MLMIIGRWSILGAARVGGGSAHEAETMSRPNLGCRLRGSVINTVAIYYAAV